MDIKKIKNLSHQELELLRSEIDKILEERKKEKDDLEKVLEFARSLGYSSIEKLGLTETKSVSPTFIEKEKLKKSTEIVKPKLRILKKDQAEFYQDLHGKWNLITAHTLRKKVDKQGLKIVKYSDVPKKELASFDLVYDNYEKKAREIYQNKVVEYNKLAKSKGLELIA